MSGPTSPDISVVIPVRNRGELIRYTLESVRRASAGVAVEVIVVDDGSSFPAAESITQLGYHPDKMIRQDNQGLLFARLTGLTAASGRYVLFLDSDDLVSPEKLRAQVAAMDVTPAAVSYTDTARCTLAGDYDALAVQRDEPCLETTDAAEFHITVQPAPHSPVFRTDYLRSIVAGALFPPSPLYNPVAEIWFYHNAAPRPARIVKVPGPHTIIGLHPGARLTSYWERLGVASLAVQEAFARACPATPAAARARQLAAEKAFAAWRRLPRGFSPDFGRRLLGIWRRLNQKTDLRKLGGGGYQTLARLFGPVGAARLLKLVQSQSYARVRTVDDGAFRLLMGMLPPP
jgi:hypothetical protein